MTAEHFNKDPNGQGVEAVGATAQQTSVDSGYNTFNGDQDHQGILVNRKHLVGPLNPLDAPRVHTPNLYLKEEAGIGGE